MEVFHVSEYVGITRSGSEVFSHSGDGVAQLVKEPAAVEQPLVIGAEAKSSAFGDTTRVVRVAWDVACYIEFGSAPTATANSKFMPVAGIEYFEVNPGDKVSVYDGVS